LNPKQNLTVDSERAASLILCTHVAMHSLLLSLLLLLIIIITSSPYRYSLRLLPTYAHSFIAAECTMIRDKGKIEKHVPETEFQPLMDRISIYHNGEQR
jgi:hypothetical protein